MPHIICCVKQVPDPETPASQFRVDEGAKKVIPAPGIAPVPSQFDTIGVEAALRIRDTVGDTTITILSVGPEGYRDAIKHCLAMGADEGILVNDPALYEADHWVTAQVLAAAIKTLPPFDIVICGRQAVDWDMGVVGSTIADSLGIPCITIAKGVQYGEGKVVVERVLPDGFETMEAPTPCVVTVSNELGEPRYPQLRQIMLAARKEVKLLKAADLSLDAGVLKNRVVLERLYIPQIETQCEFIDGETPQEKGEKLALRLREAKLI
ncbi:MAG TPA: electron transfer flavoprotein subunit beta/FixA family protein [Dehalococcoidia bacterium]|nr:electron transfer flavoprotein subunit beta/FixA family protein [Dehalococcoidia bacterium]